MTNDLKNKADELRVIPRQDTLIDVLTPIMRRERGDAQLAPIWAEKLRYTYSKVMEVKYPELRAVNGEVLPIDSSVSPDVNEWEYFLIDHAGYADFIDDDGHLMPSSAMTASRHTGKLAELGHEYMVSLFDLERAAKVGIQLNSMKLNAAKKAHDSTTNFVWLFGDSAQGIPGLCNHPNINVDMAPLNGGATSRLWENKTADEIATDVSAMINSIAENTLDAYHAAKVLLPPSLFRRMRDLRISSGGDGFSSVLDWMRDRFSGDSSGQGKVEFEILNECEAARRRDPRTGSDSSGIEGDFCLVLPMASPDELSFIRARPFTQRPPQEQRLNLLHMTHSKIGGCKCQIPLAVTRYDFGLV